MSNKAKNMRTKENAKSPLVPKLRFPEFRGAKAWEKATLSGVATVVMGSSPRSECYNQIQVGLPLIQGNADIKNRLSAPRIFTSEITKECTIGDILLSVRAPVGSVAKSIHHACIGRGIAAVRANQPNSQEFTYQWLLSYEPLWGDISQGGTFDAVNSDDLKGVTFAVPRPPEQQKIAECLSSVDEVIAAQTRKVGALKTHRSGLMQQLFPREGETQPRLRFPEFQDAGEWREGRIADIAIVLQGYGFPERHQGQTSGDYPFYKVSDISRSLSAGKVFIEESANYINESLLKELRAKPIPEGTTIFAKIGEAIRSNKRAITTVPCLIDNNAAGVKRIKGKATDFFIYLLLEQVSLIDHAGGVVPAVNKSAIEEVVVKFPELGEQERIASCFSSLDALITAETQKHEALKTHKKGLMQQLFPSPDEVEA